jgi:hypothetical protein
MKMITFGGGLIVFCIACDGRVRLPSISVAELGRLERNHKKYTAYFKGNELNEQGLMAFNINPNTYIFDWCEFFFENSNF